MTEIIQSADPLRDVLYALAIAAPAPDASVLDDLVRRYPQHAAELTDMAVALALDHLHESGTEAASPEITGQRSDRERYEPVS